MLGPYIHLGLGMGQDYVSRWIPPPPLPCPWQTSQPAPIGDNRFTSHKGLPGNQADEGAHECPEMN